MIILPPTGILLPKYRGIVDPSRPIHTGTVGFHGEVRCILYDINMNVKLDTGWEDNIITNNGLDLMRVGPYNIDYRTIIGSDGTAATITDTSIGAFLAKHNRSGASDGLQVNGITPNWISSEITSRRFDAGNGTGTVAEVCLSMNDTGTNIFNRIVLAAPIVKAADQVLDVLVRLSIHPETSDVNGVSSIVESTVPINYNTITRGQQYPLGLGAGGLADIFEQVEAFSSYSVWRAWVNTIGPIDGTPSGSGYNAENPMSYGNNTYNTGDYYMDTTVYSGLEGWNTSTDQIRTITGKWNKLPFQTQFSKVSDGTPIDKVDTQIMNFTWRITWNRV